MRGAAPAPAFPNEARLDPKPCGSRDPATRIHPPGRRDCPSQSQGWPSWASWWA